MKKALVLVLALCIGVSGLLSGCVQEGTGTLVLKITDAPGDLNITEALVTLSQVRVHYAGTNQNDTNGSWYTVVEEPQTFDLIAIQNATEFFGSANLTAGWYTQIRLHVDEALITIDGVQYDMTIPSKNIRLIRPFWIRDNETTSLIMDFDVQKSVYQTVNGTYKFKPTIKLIKE